MKKKQNHATGINSKQLLDRIASAQARLYGKLSNLDAKSLNISEYNQRYLGKKIATLNGTLLLYGRLLYLSLNDSQISPENFVLADYGGGSGLMSLLAAEMGIGTVIYNDIYDVSCTDVDCLSDILALKLDHIVCGDVNKLTSYLHGNSISVNAITSYDVIEHIYDLESHFHKLACLSDGQLRIVYASGSNISNPRYVRFVKKVQIETEYKNRDNKWGHKQRDSLRAYLDVRRDMISAYAPDLNSEIVEQLARSTRGLIQRDIEKCVDEYRQKGSITYHIDHPTNTCDPYTGNWCEHLVDFDWLRKILRKEGFSVEIMTGRYYQCGSLLKKIIKVFLNAMIQLLGRRGMFIAPYYVVCAEGKGKKGSETKKPPETCV